VDGAYSLGQPVSVELSSGHSRRPAHDRRHMIRVLTLILLGGAAFVAVYVAMPPRAPMPGEPQLASVTPLPEPQPDAAELDAPRAEEAAAAPDNVAPLAMELRQGAEQGSTSQPSHVIRDVTPATMTAGPRVTGTLVRVAASPSTAAARRERLFNPIVVSAGII